jgi:hypothetical protein
VERKPLEPAPQHDGALVRLGRALAHELDDGLRVHRRESRDGPCRAVREPLGDQLLGADEHVETVEEVRRDHVPRPVRDLEPGEVRQLFA